ncbi:hypothetical protein SAMN02745857_01540 [Andreprevotia lacus DSM 23236]|uniref:Uncharacterized protein n=1 Tax=Andreprevotia lacus DSM 23236 TaxID=1121001 RepID=A0A1W1XGG8_9NEIS|nr:hypothetical protein [Andreprevotia lacus]SMC23085.1 hypothetical protein SAMN02745857_01540 [Andreprevotia lacus DSM 23236]
MQAPVYTEIPPYGADEDTERSWQWLQAVGQLAAAELALKPRGTLALIDDGERVCWVAVIDGHAHLAIAPVFEGEVNFEHSALLRQLIGYSVEELNYLRATLEHWLLEQPTLRSREPQQLQRWATLPATLTE